MSLFLMIVVSAIVVVLYDLIKTIITLYKIEKLEDDELFSMFDDFFDE